VRASVRQRPPVLARYNPRNTGSAPRTTGGDRLNAVQCWLDTGLNRLWGA